MIVDWGLFNHSQPKPRDVISWLIYPVLYLGLVLVNGAINGWYLYPFLDLTEQTPAEFTIWVLILLAVFISFGLAMIAIRRKLNGQYAVIAV